MNITKKRIEKVKATLIIEQPYFGSIASYLKPKQNDDIKTFLSTSTTFEYNEDYIDNKSDEELAFVLTNASMHQAFSHEQRIDSRMQWLWVLATDYAINSLLVNNSLELPEDVNHDDRFDDMSAEAIYAILENEIDNENHTPEKVKQIKYEGQKPKDELEDNIKDINQELLNKSKLQGDLPLGIEIFVPKIQEGKISWRDELYEVIEQAIKFDYRLFPANKRYLSQGVALPALSGTKIKLVIAIDSSGSINTNTLSAFLAEVNAIMNSFKNYEIDLLIADAKVQEHHIMYPGDEIEYTLKGGGGTNFEAVFTYIQENINEINLLLYFTDGLGKYPENESDFDTIWVLTNEEQKVPFGRTIFL